MGKRIVFCVLLAIFAPIGALACSCAQSGPAKCGTGVGDGVLFVGTVVHVDNPAVDDGTLGGPGEATYKFHIDEAFTGTSGSEITIYSTRGGADCSFHFQQGKQYLVAPYMGPGERLFAIVCSMTRSVEESIAFLPQLRAARDHQRVASLYGVLRSGEEPYDSVTSEFYGPPLSNTAVEIRSENHTFEAKTDSNGVYAFYGVPEGKYKISAALPPNLEIAQMISNDPLPPIELPKSACYEYDVTAYPTGSITGRVLAPDGRPVTFADLELFRVERYQEKGRTGWMEAQEQEKAFFEFKHVAPGDYLLIYNNSDTVSTDTPFPRTFFPGVPDKSKAAIIHVGPGTQVKDADIKLAGGKSTRSLKVILVAEQGMLPDIHYVDGKGSDASILSNTQLSPSTTEFHLFRDTSYKIRGAGYCTSTGKESNTETVEVDGSDERATEITLTFRGVGCEIKPSDSQE
jgi:hypothetical protein